MESGTTWWWYIMTRLWYSRISSAFKVGSDFEDPWRFPPRWGNLTISWIWKAPSWWRGVTRPRLTILDSRMRSAITNSRGTFFTTTMVSVSGSSRAPFWTLIWSPLAKSAHGERRVPGGHRARRWAREVSGTSRAGSRVRRVRDGRSRLEGADDEGGGIAAGAETLEREGQARRATYRTLTPWKSIQPPCR